jgi:hypothetical protein
MGTLFVDKLDPQSGTSLEIGSSGDTITIPSGATIANSGTATGFGGTNTPRFLATMSGNQSLSDNSTTKVAFNTESIDSDSAYDTSNYRFTVPSGKAGVYYIYVKPDVAADVATDLRILRIYIYLNGSEYSPATYELDARDNYLKGGAFMAGSLMNLSVGDYVEAYVNFDTSSGSGFAITTSYSVFGGYKLL